MILHVHLLRERIVKYFIIFLRSNNNNYQDLNYKNINIIYKLIIFQIMLDL